MRVRDCVSVCVYLGVCVCVYVCVCGCMYVCVFVYISERRLVSRQRDR